MGGDITSGSEVFFGGFTTGSCPGILQDKLKVFNLTISLIQNLHVFIFYF